MRGFLLGLASLSAYAVAAICFITAAWIGDGEGIWILLSGLALFTALIICVVKRTLRSAIAALLMGGALIAVSTIYLANSGGRGGMKHFTVWGPTMIFAICFALFLLETRRKKLASTYQSENNTGFYRLRIFILVLAGILSMLIGFSGLITSMWFDTAGEKYFIFFGGLCVLPGIIFLVTIRSPFSAVFLLALSAGEIILGFSYTVKWMGWRGLDLVYYLIPLSLFLACAYYFCWATWIKKIPFTKSQS